MDDHDQRFKALLREFLPEFVKLFLPEFAPRFDFAGTEWLEQEAFLDPLLSLATCRPQSRASRPLQAATSESST